MFILAIDWWLIISKSLLIAAVIGLSFFIAMYTTYFERKVAAWLQDRIGPNRAGPFGILQPLADGGKLFFKHHDHCHQKNYHVPCNLHISLR